MLIEAARRGDLTAYDALVRRYQDVAFRTALIITGSAADAEDVAQNAFIKAWRALDRFDPEPRRARRFRRRAESEAAEASEEAAFRPWLLTIVANEARNARRSNIRHPVVPLDSLAFALEDPDSDAPAAVAEAHEQRVALVQALHRLSPDDRTVIQFRYLLDLSEGEMASLLGVPRGTIKSRLSRALQRTRAVMTTGEWAMEDRERRRG